MTEQFVQNNSNNVSDDYSLCLSELNDNNDTVTGGRN